METITLYPQWDNIHLTYWKISIKWWIIIEKSRKEIEAVISVKYEDLQRSLDKIKEWYNNALPKQEKFTLLSCSQEISNKIKKHIWKE